MFQARHDILFEFPYVRPMTAQGLLKEPKHWVSTILLKRMYSNLGHYILFSIIHVPFVIIYNLSGYTIERLLQRKKFIFFWPFKCISEMQFKS